MVAFVLCGSTGRSRGGGVEWTLRVLSVGSDGSKMLLLRSVAVAAAVGGIAVGSATWRASADGICPAEVF